MKNVFLLLASLLLGSAIAGGCRQSPPPHTQAQPFEGFNRPSVQQHPQPPAAGSTQPGTSGTAPQQAPVLPQQAPPTQLHSPSTQERTPLPQQPQTDDSFQSPETPLVD